MEFDIEFEKIRPYNNSEIPEAIEQLIANENFEKLIPFFLIDKKEKDVKKLLRAIRTIEEFQKTFSNPFLNYIIKGTSKGLTCTGVEDIKGKGHLYIANHRDIILDTAFLQLLLQQNNIPTTEITVGDNLMKNPLFSIIGKLNKVFTLYRGGGRIQMYKNAILHAKYINNVIREKNESLWIAQRDGRTKDGNDKTQQGLLKMLLGNRRDIVPALQELAIVPVSTSYELEPCLKSKIRETYLIRKNGTYTKDEKEDMYAVSTSTLAPKGRIHIGFGKRLNVVLKNINEKELTDNEIVNVFVNEIDKQIYENYKLWPYNYLAYDRLNNKSSFTDKYTSEDIKNFEFYIEESISDIEGNKDELKTIAFEIYANPLINKLAISD